MFFTLTPTTPPMTPPVCLVDRSSCRTNYAGYGYLESLHSTPLTRKVGVVYFDDKRWDLTHEISVITAYETGLWTVTCPPFYIHAYGADIASAWENFGEQFAMLIEEYAHADDENLSNDAIRLKKSLLEIVQQT